MPGIQFEPAQLFSSWIQRAAVYHAPKFFAYNVSANNPYLRYGPCPQGVRILIGKEIKNTGDTERLPYLKRQDTESYESSLPSLTFHEWNVQMMARALRRVCREGTCWVEQKQTGIPDQWGGQKAVGSKVAKPGKHKVEFENSGKNSFTKDKRPIQDNSGQDPWGVHRHQTYFLIGLLNWQIKVVL